MPVAVSLSHSHCLADCTHLELHSSLSWSLLLLSSALCTQSLLILIDWIVPLSMYLGHFKSCDCTTNTMSITSFAVVTNMVLLLLQVQPWKPCHVSFCLERGNNGEF